MAVPPPLHQSARARFGDAHEDVQPRHAVVADHAHFQVFAVFYRRQQRDDGILVGEIDVPEPVARFKDDVAEGQ